MMAAHLVFSMHILRRHDVLTANTTMFGITAVMESGFTVIWVSRRHRALYRAWDGQCVSPRLSSLQSFPPATVDAYHNLIPICTIAIDHLSLGEPVTAQTMIGALGGLGGTEFVRRQPAWTVLSPYKGSPEPRGPCGRACTLPGINGKD